MDKQLVLVTGAVGLLGSAICRELLDDYQVVGLDVKDPDPGVEGVTYIPFDVTSDESVEKALGEINEKFGKAIASVVHLAAYYDFSGEPSKLYDEVTVKGSGRLLKHLQSFEVEQFMFSSTMLVHKPTEPGRPISEDDPLKAKWDYPESKINAENTIKQTRGDIPVVLLRIAGVYTDACDSIPISQQIRRIAEKEMTAYVYPGDISHGQAFLHMEDLTKAIRKAIEHRKELEPEETFLIGEPVTYSYDEIQRTLGRLIHGDNDWKTREIPKAMAKSGAKLQDTFESFEDPFIKPWMIDMADDHYELDITRASKKLEWQPAHTLVKTLPKMVESLKRDPQEFYTRHDLGKAPSDLELAGTA